MSPNLNSSEVFDIVSAFYPGFSRENLKIIFLISNVSAGHITLCRKQHVARELGVKLAL
jgi:hypothetical protein